MVWAELLQVLHQAPPSQQAMERLAVVCLVVHWEEPSLLRLQLQPHLRRREVSLAER